MRLAAENQLVALGIWDASPRIESGAVPVVDVNDVAAAADQQQVVEHYAESTPEPPKPVDEVVDVYPVLRALQSNKDFAVITLSEDPLVLMIDDFATPAECDILIEHMKKLGLQRSTVVGGVTADKFKRVDSPLYRSSSNTWCQGACYDDEIVKRLDARIMALVDRPSREYAEHFQLLQYEVGQFYKVHNDFIPSQRTAPGGHRLYTAYVYLNGNGVNNATLADLPCQGECVEGGETEFTDLGLKVKPKRGRLIVWPNVEYGTASENKRTNHAALPVLSGVKYGANKWVHSANFIQPWSLGFAM